MTNREKLVETFPNGAYTGSRTWMSMEYEEPTNKEEMRWIPVKVRLPKKSEYGDVLVTITHPAGELWDTVMKAHYSDLMGIAKPCFHIGEVGKKNFEDITPRVTAWISLPKPYRESERRNK